MVNGGYDVAQICLNGHVINASGLKYPDFNKNYYNICGVKTIMTCLNCNSSIQGFYHNSFQLEYFPPSFCHHCGQPYPWTMAKMDAAKEIASEIENISDEEKEILIKSLNYIVFDTPKTEVASFKMKKILHKAGGTAKKLFSEIVIKIASEAAKGYLGF